MVKSNELITLFILDQEAAFVCPECDDLFGAFPDFEKHCRDDHK